MLRVMPVSYTHLDVYKRQEYFDRMKDRNLYCIEPKLIKKIVEAEGLSDIYNR